MDVEAEPARPSRRRSIISIGLTVVVAGVVFGLVFPQLIDWGLVFDLLGQVDVWQIVVLVLLGVIRYLPAGWVYSLMLPGLSFRRGVSSWVATTALASSTPGFDIPLRFAMYASWGYPAERTASAAFLSGIVEMSTKYALAVVAVGLWALYSFDATLAILAAVGVGILAVGAFAVSALLRSEGSARRFAALVGRVARWGANKMSRPAAEDLEERIMSVRVETREVLGSRSGKAFLASGAFQALNFAIVLLSLRAVGVESDLLAWYDVLLAQGVMIILTTIPITPGNVGIAEMIYVGVFVAIAGRDAADLIAAGVILSRLITWLLPVPIGWVITLRWQAQAGMTIFGGRSGPRQA